jgi:hypothetical protein
LLLFILVLVKIRREYSLFSIVKPKSDKSLLTYQEIQEMRGYLSRAAGIKFLDQETKQTIQDTEAYLRRMEANTFNIPRRASSFAFEMLNVADGGCYATLVMILVLMALFGAPLLMLIWGFSLLTGGSISRIFAA